MSAWWLVAWGAALILLAVRRQWVIRRDHLNWQMGRRAVANSLWPGSNANRWPPPSRCTPEWPCNPEDSWICTTHVNEGISVAESWANHG